MAKIADVQEVSLEKLRPYERNAKKHGAGQIEKLKASIMEFGFLTPCLIDCDYNLIAGHGRVMAAKDLGIETVPCVFIEGLTDEQRRAYILADNRLGELGEWDWNIVNAELIKLDDEDFVVELTGFEMPDHQTNWFQDRERFDMSRQEGNEAYNEFLDKFEEPKTTDDCYTPDNIYDVIAEYVETKYGKSRDNFVRPFFPGGDYQVHRYKDTDVVVDNPPFSILAEIVDFYVEKNQPFFLFAPGLSTIGYTKRKGVTAICCYAGITYENGACVTTSFITNMDSEEVAAMTDPDLFKKIAEANKENEVAMHRSFPKYEFPMEVLTAAKMGYLSKYGQEIKILRKDSMFIRTIDAMKESGKGIYGNAFLLSERAAAERAAAERAAAERAAATCWKLSERELEIVKSLGVQNGKEDTARASQ